MRTYWLIALGLIVFFLTLFGVVRALDVPLLNDAEAMLGMPPALAAAVGVGLLLVDVLLPVPSSFVMVAHGTLFGAVGGTALSLLGTVGATALAFALGRRGGPLLDRLVSPEERARGDRLLERYGGLAVVATRPLPLLAETVAILAGTSPMSWPRLLLAATLGALPPSLLYAITGAKVAALDDQLLIMGGVMGCAAVFWLVARQLEARLS